MKDLLVETLKMLNQLEEDIDCLQNKYHIDYDDEYAIKIQDDFDKLKKFLDNISLKKEVKI